MTTEEPLLATEAPSESEEQQTAPVTPDSESSTTTTEQPEQEQATEEPKQGAPETYEFTKPKGLPEGSEIDPEIHDAYAEAARDLDLPQEAAQGLFDKTMVAIHDRALAVQEQQTSEWVDAVKSDKDIGGDKLEENLGIAKKAMDEFGSDGLSDLLNGPIGNHPDVVRFMVKVGRAISEDRFVGSNTGQAVDPNDEASLARVMYPTHTS